MKLVKFVPAIAATLVLAACSTANDVASSSVSAVSNTAGAVTESASNVGVAVVNSVSGTAEVTQASVKTSVGKINTTSKSVAYKCLNKVKVSATYAFEGDKPKAVNLQLGKKVITGLLYDASNQDQPTFKSDKYVWNLDNDFYQDIYKSGAMLTEDGKDSDMILAKLCEVDKATTKRLK